MSDWESLESDAMDEEWFDAHRDDMVACDVCGLRETPLDHTCAYCGRVVCEDCTVDTPDGDACDECTADDRERWERIDDAYGMLDGLPAGLESQVGRILEDPYGLADESTQPVLNELERRLGRAA